MVLVCSVTSNLTFTMALLSGNSTVGCHLNCALDPHLASPWLLPPSSPPWLTCFLPAPRPPPEMEQGTGQRALGDDLICRSR